jgi:uncharacterized protein involved in response to NO
VINQETKPLMRPRRTTFCITPISFAARVGGRRRTSHGASQPVWPSVGSHRLIDRAALLNAVRLSRWAGWASWPEKLLFILHVGYAWVVLGTALLGLSIFNIGVPTSSAIHALTAGAIAVMILAVMPRVTLGHTGRDLIAGRATVAVFVLINSAAIFRICASWHTALMATLLLVAGALWIAAFGLFELIYGSVLLTRRGEA